MGLILATSLRAQQAPEETTPAPQEPPKRTEPAAAVSAPVLASSVEPDAAERHDRAARGAGPADHRRFCSNAGVLVGDRIARIFCEPGFNVGGSYDDNALITSNECDQQLELFDFSQYLDSTDQEPTALGFGLCGGGLTVNEEFSREQPGLSRFEL